MFRSLTAICAALAAATVVAVSAAPASATTYHRQINFLRWPPKIIGGFTCVGRPGPDRRIRLNGTYTWRAYVKNRKHPHRPTVNSRTVTLHGLYDWQDCLFTDAISGRPVYHHRSVIFNVRTNGHVGLDNYYYGRFGQGNYEWGSTLNNVRAR
jgi:hypothetical protein